MFLFKFKEKPSLERLTEAMCAALAEMGMSLYEADSHTRTNYNDVLDVLGVVKHDEIDYDILFNDKKTHYDPRQYEELQQLLNGDQYDADLYLAQSGVNIGTLIRPKAHLHWFPKNEDLVFLRRLASCLQARLPEVDTFVIAYRTEMTVEGGVVFEKVEASQQ